jgi:hypothetical protein
MMYFRVLLILVLIALLAACEVRTVPQVFPTYRRCTDVENLKLGEASNKLEDLLKQQDYDCIEQLLRAGTIREADPHVVSILISLLTPNASAGPDIITSSLPNTTKLVALHYLNAHMRPAKALGFSLEPFGEFIRAEASRGTGQARVDAYLLLYNIMQESDIPSIVDGIKTGDESMIAVGSYALADSCSPAAIAALKETLKHQAVVSYLQKYKDKEDITKVLRQRCPAALPYLNR